MDSAKDDDLKVGDLVVGMAEPGPFTVVEIHFPNVVIETASGPRKTMHAGALRRVSGDAPVAR